MCDIMILENYSKNRIFSKKINGKQRKFDSNIFSHKNTSNEEKHKKLKRNKKLNENES